VERKGVGVRIDPVFPDPDGVPELMELAQTYADPEKGPLVDDRKKCEQWNCGQGFLCVIENMKHADQLIALAASMGYEAAQVGEVTDTKSIEWRGHTWTY
jgi:phosphoribosylaminoimidazole (AIR) synthetase